MDSKRSKVIGDSVALCYYVMEHAKHVYICKRKVDEFAKEIELLDHTFWLSSNPYQLFSLPISDIIHFMLLFDSIDYSFWGNPKWTVITDEGPKDGSDALLYVLLKYVKQHSISELYQISFSDFKTLLQGNVEIPFLKERYETIHEISSIVKERMNGNFYQCIKNITLDTELLDYIVKNFPSFCDVRTYLGKTIPFYKLAQLLTSDILQLRYLLEHISIDYSHLIGCADYKIPQIQRALGLVQYDETLAGLVDSKQELEENSNYEIEIRASMIVVIDMIQKKNPNVCAMDINDYFFLSSKKLKNMKPYHLCRNRNY